MSSARRHHWREEVVAPSGAASSPIVLPRRIDGVTAVVSPGAGGSAYLEYTLSDAELALLSPASALWLIWESGSVVQAVGQPATLQVAAWTDF